LETSPGDYPKLAKLLKKKKVVTKALSKGDHLILYAPNGEKALNELMSAAHKLKERVISVEMNKPSLDDFFATIVEQNEQ
jgi:hypothetical protein